jgi:hypothetical protein
MGKVEMRVRRLWAVKCEARVSRGMPANALGCLPGAEKTHEGVSLEC